MSEYTDKILDIIKPEEGRGRNGLGNMLLSLTRKDQLKAMKAVSDYEDRFEKASPDYRAMVTYLMIGVIQSHEVGDNISDRIELECFGEHISTLNGARNSGTIIDHDRVYQGKRPDDEDEDLPFERDDKKKERKIKPRKEKAL